MLLSETILMIYDNNDEKDKDMMICTFCEEKNVARTSHFLCLFRARKDLPRIALLFRASAGIDQNKAYLGQKPDCPKIRRTI